MKPMVRAVLRRIGVDAKRLNDQELDPDTVCAYAEDLAKSDPPPILVAMDARRRIFVLDGFHRLAAAVKAGRRAIWAWVVPYRELIALCRKEFREPIRSLSHFDDYGECGYGELDDLVQCGEDMYERP